MTEAPEASLPSLFTAKDRCDRCGAQAKTMALLVSGFLLFCNHHTNKYRYGLLIAGAEIVTDEG